MASSGRQGALVLSVLGLLALNAPLMYRLGSLQGLQAWLFGGLGILLYIMWLALESRLSARELRLEVTEEDQFTTELCAIAKIVLLLAALIGGGVVSWRTAGPGLGLLLAGIALRGVAIRQLGSSYRFGIRLPEVLHTDGVYAFMRHPAYAGTLMAHAGVVLVFFNPFSVAAFTFLWVPAVLWRMMTEERLLRAAPAYAAYAQGET